MKEGVGHAKQGYDAEAQVQKREKGEAKRKGRIKRR
jgi:hypothetical protein